MKKTFAIRNRNIMPRTITWTGAIVAAHFLATSGRAQTYTWADNAQGQIFLQCPDGSGGFYNSYWPSNSDWSQSVVMGGNCDNTAQVVSQPSNWDPTPPTGIYPGGPGLQGVDVVIGAPTGTLLDAQVVLNSLTLQTNGALSIRGSATMMANRLEFQGDGILVNAGLGGGNPYVTIANGGTLVKSGGTGTYNLGPEMELYGSTNTIEVDSGTLALSHEAYLDGGTLAVSNNATLLLTMDNNALTELNGNFDGTGVGTVLFNNGVLSSDGGISYGFSLNLPGTMFQWTGGALESYLTNNNVINLTNNPGIVGGRLFNNAEAKLADNSTLNDGGEIYNDAGGTFDIEGDSSVTGSGYELYNSGLLKKSAGAGLSQIFPRFNDFSGTLEVDTGTLAVNVGANASYFSNTTFVVSSGATLDFSVSNLTAEIEGTLTGSGGGMVLMNSGTVNSYDQATLNFPGSMFQWQGGSLGGNYSYVTNVGTINITGPVGLIGQDIANNGNMIQSGTGAIGGGSGFLVNNPGGVYQIQNDNDVLVNYLYNHGLLEKTGGTGTNTISGTFNNSGGIQAASGSFFFTGGYFNQNAGTLLLTPAISFGSNLPFYLNGGTVTGTGMLGGSAINNSVNVEAGGVLAPGNPFGILTVAGGSGIVFNNGAVFNVVLGSPTRFSQLTVSNGVALENGSTLNVTLTNGYVPAMGTQFQIISSPNTAGSFTTLNVPYGLSVNYSNNGGVYLVVTGPVAAQLQSPQISGGNFSFSFATTNGQSYTVQQTTNLATTNWTFYTNITGNGSLYQFTTPVTNIPQRFFRVSQP